MIKLIFCYLLLCVLCLCQSYEILIIIPSASKSLSNIFLTLGKGLVVKGHNITFITPIIYDHEAMKSFGINYVPMQLETDEVEDNIFEAANFQNSINLLFNRSAEMTEVLWSDPKIMTLWECRKDFDLIVTMSYLSEMVFPFLIDNPAVFVQVCTPGVEYHSISREGNWLMPSVVPSILLNMDDYMTFWERVVNLPVMVFMYTLETYLLRKLQKGHLDKYFSHMDNLGSYYDRVALTLINGHYSLDGPVPLLPSQIEIGTINIKQPEPLDKELATFVDGSGEAGIVLFSLGSIAKSTDIPQQLKNVFVEAFKRIPQRVLWKYEGKDLDLPPNVMTRKWIPQQDILRHPKTKVFISHCGNLGTQEAKYYGVPVLGLPIAFDQPRNAARMARKGYAIVFSWQDITVDKIVDSLNTLINDTSYRDRLQSVSRVLKDQKESPLERAVWWLEYVVRHKGAPHLQYAGKRLSIFQYVMLDVILLYTVLVGVLVFMVLCFIRCLFKKINNKLIVSKRVKNKRKVQ